MDEDKIKALSREYAEEKVVSSGFSQSTYEELLNDQAEIVAYIIRWLTSRFCIVEKSKVKEEYNLALSNFKRASCARPLNQAYFDGRGDAIKSLFPEIAKEVSHE